MKFSSAREILERRLSSISTPVWQKPLKRVFHLAITFIFSLQASFQAKAAPASICRNFFLSTTPHDIITENLARLGSDFFDPRITEFTERIKSRVSLGELEMRELSQLVLKERLQLRKSNDPLRVLYEKLVTDKTPNVILDRFIEQQVIKHGFTKALQDAGFFSEPSRRERWRLFLKRYQISSLLTQSLAAMPAVFLAGPVAVPFAAIGWRPTWLSSREIDPELLARLHPLIEQGLITGFDTESRAQIDKLFATRAKAEAVHEWLRTATMILFFAALAYFVQEEGPWLEFGLLGYFFPPTKESVERARQKIGIDRRVEIQTQDWSQGFRRLFNRPPSETELGEKTQEIRKILSSPDPGT